MSDKAIWVTVEEPTQNQLRQIRDHFEDTDLGDRYEIIVTDDGIDTIPMDELREVINND